MQDFNVLHFSDLHLSEARAYNLKNWNICLEEIATRRPDLVVVGGDMVLDDPDVQADQIFARRQLDGIRAPWRAVPGNHDVGDSLPAPYQNQPISEERIARYNALYGADWWHMEIPNWRLIGINSQLSASGLSAEKEQFKWLADTLSSAGDSHIAIFAHKPLCLDTIEEQTVSQFLVHPDSRRDLWKLIKQFDVRLIASGHTHRFRTLSCDGIPMVWAPTTAQINLNMKSPKDGWPDQHAGFVWYRFRPNAVEWELVQPSALVALDITALSSKYGPMRNAPEFRLADLVLNSEPG
jgi:3',5'-cyclic AMP phosphodiesterase CpdA